MKIDIIQIRRGITKLRDFLKRKIVICLLLIFIIGFAVMVGIWLNSANPTVGIVYSDTYAKKYGLNIEGAVSNLVLQNTIDYDNIFIKESTGDMSSAFECIETLAAIKCDVIVVICDNSIDAVQQAATEYNKIIFCTFGEEKQNSSVYSNVKGFNFAVHELRYVNGYLAGLKLKEMADNEQIDKGKQIIGYIADERTPENISAYSAMYLGARAANKDIKLYVKYIDNKIVHDKTAKALIANGCNLIALQDSNEDVRAICSKNNIAYSEFGDVPDNEQLISHMNCRLESYLLYIIDCKKEKKEISDGWCGGFNTDSLSISISQGDIFNNHDEIQTQTDELTERLRDSSLKVFDTSTWMVSGKKIKSALSGDGSGTEYINPGGYFAEGEISPNPQFAFKIDGIEILK